ncbi:MAG: hypothetical protein N4A43_02900 [Alphaproteobacteria bacterium]|jgi:hypothetical protein|nr:hypothetical protein [Alphaproteobacteria bacterium]
MKISDFYGKWIPYAIEENDITESVHFNCSALTDSFYKTTLEIKKNELIYYHYKTNYEEKKKVLEYDIEILSRNREHHFVRDNKNKSLDMENEINYYLALTAEVEDDYQDWKEELRIFSNKRLKLVEDGCLWHYVKVDKDYFYEYKNDILKKQSN